MCVAVAEAATLRGWLDILTSLWFSFLRVCVIRLGKSRDGLFLPYRFCYARGSVCAFSAMETDGLSAADFYGHPDGQFFISPCGRNK